MPSLLPSSLMLGSRPGIPEKLIETEHQLQFSSTTGKLTVTGCFFFFIFGEVDGPFLERPNVEALWAFVRS